MYSDGRRRLKKRPKVVAPIEKFFRDHGAIAKTYIMPYLYNVVPNRTMTKTTVELSDKFGPGLHAFKVAMLSKIMRKVSERMYWPRKPEKFAKDSTMNRFVEMLYAKPDFLDPHRQEMLNCAKDTLTFLKNQKTIEAFQTAWENEAFGGSVLDPIKA